MTVHEGKTSAASPNRVPALWVALGAASLSVSAVLITLADVSAPTAAFYRCALALIPLAPFVLRDVLRHGFPELPVVGMALLGGSFLGIDYLMWNVSIADVGAGIATVLVNMQVVLFPLVMWAVAGVRPARRFVAAIPILLVGVALAGGVVGPGPAGGNAVRGTLLSLAAALAYSGYLYFGQRCGVRAPRHFATPVFLATAAAAVMSGVVGTATSGIAFDLGPESWLCLALVALFGQAIGWLLVGYGLPRLDPALSSTLLLLQPIGAALLGAVVLDEVPTATQLAGCAAVLVTVWVTALGGSRAAGRRRARKPEAAREEAVQESSCG
ncbi:MAG: DMT family transporter [Saccharopolyspora sp.]|uniref:DMT family transporter n=1 Tax=Saccharopolyspora sp. TaxID=33915 RepID=UPI0025F3CDD0|nr:DMT family transporter [Saccharopolyspora sp.]MBQ6644660.1 DMT family transporter [Saccharopolyspora sp.]